MLNIFRQGGLVKTLMGGVVILIAAAFIFTSQGASSVALAECVVRVDQSCVPAKDYNFLMRLVAPPGATNKQLREAGFSDRALAALVERELLLQEARRLGVTVSGDAVDKELATGRVHYSWPVDSPVPAALLRGSEYPRTGAAEPVSYIRVKNSKTGAFDYAIYTRQVRSLLRMSPRDFKKLQRDELTAARVRALVTAPVRVSEEEAYSQFDLGRSKATVRYVEAKSSWFERVGGDLSDAAAKAYDGKNSDAVKTAWDKEKGKWKAGCPLVSEILFRFSPGADADERASHNTLASEAGDLLKAGVPFTVLAQAYSDASTAKAGGELGCLSKDYGPVADDLLKHVAGLKAGEVSTALETAQGIHLLQFHGELAADSLETTGRLAVARRAMARAGAAERAQEFLRGVITKAKAGEELNTVVEAQAKATVELVLSEHKNEKLVAQLLGKNTAPVVEISRAFTRASNPVPGLKSKSAAAQVFKLEKDDDLIAEPLESFTGFVALQLKEKDLVSREDFDSEKADLVRGIQEQKRSDAISEYLARLRKRAKRIELDETRGKPKTEGAPSDSNETNSG